MPKDIRRMRAVSDQVAIVGVGNTDYGDDYKAARAKSPGYVAPDSYGLAITAFQRALADRGLKKEDIDGFGTSGQVKTDRMRESLGVQSIWEGTGALGELLPAAVEAIASGQCTTVAIMQCFAQRSMGVTYGGPAIEGGPLTYPYYHPWGWSAQGAHWAMMFKRHQFVYGSTEEQLGAVPVTIRKNAMLNPYAVMRNPLIMDDYMQSRYVCRPLHLFDYCMVNDGCCCLILRRADMAKDLLYTPVLVSGYASLPGMQDKSQLRKLVMGLNHVELATATQHLFAMASLT